MQLIRKAKEDKAITKSFRTAMAITIGGNVFLAAIKAFGAKYSGSVALYADAANSISDVIYSVLLVIGLYLSLRPPDETHPQGHSRFEPLVGLVVALTMSFAGYEAARSSIERLTAGGQVVEPGLPTIILIGSALTKFGMFLAIRNIARKVHSPALETTSLDHISDVLTSTVALIGILTSSLNPLFDAIAGILVALWIFRAAFNAGKDHISFLTGGSASSDLREQIVRIAETEPGVLRVHHIITEYVGPQLVVEMHVNVRGTTPLHDAHIISDNISAKIEQLPDIDRVYVHLEPDDWTD